MWIMCSTSEERKHQMAIRQYIFGNAVRQHLYDVETGRVTSPYLQKYFDTINKKDGVWQLMQVGLGPMLGNQTEVNYVIVSAQTIQLFTYCR